MCTHSQKVYNFVPFKNPTKKAFNDPTWAFHIKSECRECGQYLGFVKQSKETMQELNGATLIPKPKPSKIKSAEKCTCSISGDCRACK